MFGQDRLHDAALDADAAAMDDSNLEDARPNALLNVFLNDARNVARRERVEIDGILDGKDYRPLERGVVVVFVASHEKEGRGISPP